MANRPGYYKEYYARNRERLIARSAEQKKQARQEAREYIAALKSRTSCADCGAIYPDRPYRMTFDHLPGHEKEANLSDAANQGWSKKRLDIEIAKCEIVCLLCHADRTHERGISANGNTPPLQGGVRGSTPLSST